MVLVALLVGLLGALGLGLKNVVLVSFVLGFVVTGVYKSRYIESFPRLFASSIVGGIITVIASIIIFVLLEVLFIVAIVLIVLFLIGLILFFVRMI